MLPAPTIIRDISLTSEQDLWLNTNDGCTHVYKIPKIGDYIFDFTWSFHKHINLYGILMNNWTTGLYNSLSLSNDINITSIELVLTKPDTILARINNPFQKSVNLLSGNIVQYKLDFLANNDPLLLSAIQEETLYIVFNFASPPKQEYHLEYKIGFVPDEGKALTSVQTQYNYCNGNIRINQQVYYQLDNVFYAVNNFYCNGHLSHN